MPSFLNPRSPEAVLVLDAWVNGNRKDATRAFMKLDREDREAVARAIGVKQMVTMVTLAAAMSSP